MHTVNTALGPVDGANLGQTLMHEHVFVLSPEIEKTAQEWDEESAQATAIQRLQELKASGIDTIVDLTVIGLGRFIPRIVSVANRVPTINVVVATGVYTYNEVPMFFHFRGPIYLFGKYTKVSETPVSGPESSNVPPIPLGSLREWSGCCVRWPGPTAKPALRSPPTHRHRLSLGASSNRGSWPTRVLT
jgi:hypothetical protein